MGDTLVLSRSFEPVDRIPWTRAITLLWQNEVEVLESYDDWVVRSVSLEIPVPMVIRRLSGTYVRHKKIKFSRMNVYRRDGGRCQYCANPVLMANMTYDHVIPRTQGGHTGWTNVVISCSPCNQKKGGRRPEQARMKLLSVPKEPKSLPGGMTMTVHYQPGMPEAWKKWIRDQAYWHVELEQD